jgi:alkylresorcinol/alkylpyrone synthase
MNPKIISLGTAFPPNSYTQEEIFKALGYPKHFWRIFRDAQIQTRYFVLPPDELKKLSFQRQQEEYFTWSGYLARQALIQALDSRNPAELGLICFATCTGFPPGPTVAHYLVYDLGLPNNIQINNISSHGCEAALPGLRRCYDFTALTGKMSAAINCELCSLTYFPEEDGKPDPENDYELLRSNAIFADACSSAIIGFDDNPRHPEIIDFASYLDTEYFWELGYAWRDGRLRVLLSKRVPDIATELLGKAVNNLLAKNNLTIHEIRYWVIHPPGAIVLDKIRDSLGISEEKLKYSRKALQGFGNVSSASVGVVGKLLMSEEVNPSGYLIMANVGPGMVSNAVLLRFGG